MKLPRDISSDELSRKLNKLGYVVTRQTGSHMRLTRIAEEEHHLTILRHKNLKIGTLNNILKDVAKNLGKSKDDILNQLFG